MGILGRFMGHASGVDLEKLEQEFSQILVEGEAISGAYKLVRDLLVLTNRRLILVDKQGMTGRKTAYVSIPYGSVSQFSIETAGSFDMDAELSIWVRGRSEPIKQDFGRGSSIHEVHRILAGHVLK